MNEDDNRINVQNRLRNCRLCRAKLRGRVDKKFCSTQCKSQYHRKLRQVTADVTVDIDKILHRNRSILLEVMGKTSKKKKLPRIELEKRKFNFFYMTHYIVNSKGKTFHYLYDFAWMTFSDDEVLIIRK